jgi:hypothetical protein
MRFVFLFILTSTGRRFEMVSAGIEENGQP